MSPRPTVRRQLAWVTLVVLACCAVASLRLHRRAAPHGTSGTGCVMAGRDSTKVARFAVDTIEALRARTQRVRLFVRTSDGVQVRTEDNDSLSIHDGGLAVFDCAGRLTFLWLDGG